MPPKTTYDLIAIGESLHDVFFLIDEATASCTIDKQQCRLSLAYGEKIPVRKVIHVPAAGNSSNAAVGASRLGLKSALVSWIGTDSAGESARHALIQDNVDTRYLIRDSRRPTSEATILNYDHERTQLVYFQHRDYHLPKLASTRCIYYSAMGKTSATFDRSVLDEVTRQKKTLFVFQPGTTHIRKGLKALKTLIAHSGLFTLNAEEARQLIDEDRASIPSMLEVFARYGAGIIIITDGKQGAFCYDGRTHRHMPIFPGLAVEPTGAGDSFATGVTAALLKGESIDEALRWGTANSWNVVREIGPQKGLLTTSGMHKILKKYAAIQPKLTTIL